MSECVCISVYMQHASLTVSIKQDITNNNNNNVSNNSTTSSQPTKSICALRFIIFVRLVGICSEIRLHLQQRAIDNNNNTLQIQQKQKHKHKKKWIRRDQITAAAIIYLVRYLFDFYTLASIYPIAFHLHSYKIECKSKRMRASAQITVVIFLTYIHNEPYVFLRRKKMFVC